MKRYAIIEPLNWPARSALVLIQRRTDRVIRTRDSILNPKNFPTNQFRHVGDVAMNGDRFNPADLPVKDGYLVLDMSTGYLHAPEQHVPGPHLYELLGFPEVEAFQGREAQCLYLIAEDLKRARHLLGQVVPHEITASVLVDEHRSLPVFLTPAALAQLGLAFLEDQRRRTEAEPFKSVFSEIHLPAEATAERSLA